VIVRRTAAQYHSRRESNVARLSTIGAGYQRLLDLQAKYGSETQASLDLENTEILDADLRGPCGAPVVTKVFVGRGKRRLFASTTSSAKLTASTAVASATPATESNGKALDEIAWTENQAYAFDVRDVGGGSDEALRIDVKLASILTEGEEVHVFFESAGEAYLVVLYVDADGKGEILWPSNEEPAPRIPPGGRAVLPSPAEEAAGIKIRPTLSKPGARAREQFFVYAFADRRDFDLVKPSAGTSAADGAAYADELVGKLRNVPARRWSRTALVYTIEPKKR
jgi:hypothetical protein